MGDRIYAKFQAQQKTLIGSAPEGSLLQRTCACGQHTNAGNECPTCRSKYSSLPYSKRTFESPSASVASKGNSPAQEDVSTLNANINMTSRFGHDFSQIPVHSSRPLMLQTKLTVNQPGDIYEQEANQVAEQVMRMTHPAASPNDNEEQIKDSLMRKQSNGPGAYAATGSSDAPPIVQNVLSSGGGQPLDVATRAFMEPRFGHDFSQVRVHTDERAAGSVGAVNALAYTVGRDVVFGKGQYAPETSEGRRLLAHELTHVAQQQLGRASASGASIQYPQQAEWEAERNAQEAGSLTTTCYLPALMRAPQPQGQQQKEDAPSSEEETDPQIKEAIESFGAFKQADALIFKVRGHPVAVLPSIEGNLTDPNAESETRVRLHFLSENDCLKDQSEGKVMTIPSLVGVTIQTVYKPKVNPDLPSAYGIGTRPEDVGEHKNLRYHEQSHAVDALAYIRDHPIPSFAGNKGMAINDFKVAYKKFKEKITQYFIGLAKSNVENIDCAGKKTIDQFYHEKGINATIKCKKPEEKKLPTK
jgi:hypothetical protein